ncbi:uncharacterized protein [Parasteatoda tepidariorum]|uniref:uncharacterized protein n=1 Tax=Parasteatoda tepidariorum TaxID=114398 RepID=UPI0039BD273B
MLVFTSTFFRMNPVILIFYYGCVFFKQALSEECMPTFVDCYCENYLQHNIQITVNTVLKRDEDTDLTLCVSAEYPPDVCAKRNCSILPNKNFASLFGKGRKINLGVDEDKNLLNKRSSKKFMNAEVVFRKRRFSNKLVDMIASRNFPIEIVIPAGTHNDKIKRSVGKNCVLPPLENSEVTCWVWPEWRTCNQQCIYGYGLEYKKGTVTKTSMACRDGEDEWKPQSIQDCKPYLNCKTHLISPGELNCVQLTKEPSYCQIKCQEYDNQTATTSQKYICDEYYSPPHCAALDDSVTLIEAPSA